MTALPAPLNRVVDGARWYTRACFSLDLRSLALFRIGLALVLFVDALTRARDAETFYSSLGVARRVSAEASLFDRVFASHPSLYNIDGSTEFQLALLIFTAFTALVFLVGYRTRITGFALWALQLSIINRCDGVNTGADSVMIALMAWACLLPVGARFSIDQKRRPTYVGETEAVVSWVTFAFVLQIVTIYFFNVINKNTAAWWRGNAVMIALQIDGHATMIGVFAREHLQFLAKPLTWGTIVAEASPLLLFVPWKSSHIRVFLVATLWALHLGFAVCMYLSLFSPACMVGWLALLPTALWARRPFARVDALFARARVVAPAVTPARIMRARKLGAVLTAAIAILLTVMHLGSNIQSSLKTSLLPRPLAKLAGAMHIHQPWKMFHTPGTNDGWWVMPGTLADGREIDVFRDISDPVRGGAKVSFKKPKSIATSYPTGRWRKFMMTSSGEPQTGMRTQMARYLCMRWNREHTGPEELLKLEMIYMLEKTNKKAEVLKPRPISLLDYDCRTGRGSRKPKKDDAKKAAPQMSTPPENDDDDNDDVDATP